MKRFACVVLCAFLFYTSVVAADESPAEKSGAGSQQVERDDSFGSGLPAGDGLKWLDWILIGCYALATIGVGVHFSRRQRSTREYFVGSGNLHPLIVGISIFATLMSTISYLSAPGEAMGKGPVGGLMGLTILPLVYITVAYGLLPIIMKQRLTSAYELLETKLGLSIRLLGATMFLMLRLVWMTLLVYLAAKALTVMMGVHPKWVPLIVLVTGTVSVIYTTLGGLRAVVVTDCMQTILLFVGAVLVIVTISWDFGGFGWFPTTWQENWDTQPFFSFDPRTRVTGVGTILSGYVWIVATQGGDQTCVQRYMATRDLKAARQAYVTKIIVGVIVSLTLVCVGFALLGYFQAHPEYMPVGKTIEGNADDLFPFFIAYRLPMGVSGLVVAAMFAAAMSSIDSGVNSITAVVKTDFLDRLGFGPKTEKGNVRTAQLLALGIGIVVVLGSSFIKYIEGNILEVTSKAVNLLTTPIFGLFVFALFIPFARTAGVWVGAICGTSTAAMISFSGAIVGVLATRGGVDPGLFGVELITQIDPATGEQWLTAEDPISFQWAGPAALLVNVVTGSLASWLLPAKKRPSPPVE